MVSASVAQIDQAMSFLSDIQGFDSKSLKPVDTNLTTANGRKVCRDF